VLKIDLLILKELSGEYLAKNRNFFYLIHFAPFSAPAKLPVTGGSSWLPAVDAAADLPT